MQQNKYEYMKACPNHGTCRVLLLEEQGVPMNPMIEIRPGTKRVEKFYSDNVPAFINYHNCTGCGLPYNQAEADKVNKFLGLRAADIPLEVTDDFLKALGEF